MNIKLSDDVINSVFSLHSRISYLTGMELHYMKDLSVMKVSQNSLIWPFGEHSDYQTIWVYAINMRARSKTKTN